MTKHRKSAKEKLMPFKQQVVRIKQYLTNRGIEVRLGEIEDYMSPDLHYDENKHAVLDVFGQRQTRQYSTVDAFLEQAHNREDERSERAQQMDYHKCAAIAWTPKEVAADEKKALKWLNSPNRYDVIGVDAKDKCPRVKKREKKEEKDKIKNAKRE